MATWQISGEAGKTFGTNKVTFDAINALDPLLILNTLEPDRFTFRQLFATPAESETIDLTQVINVWRDGVKMFKGNVIDRKIDDSTEGVLVETVVEGPWWWLANTPLSGDVTDSFGQTQERILFGFPLQQSKTSLEALIDRAIELGCPITKGSISEGYVLPQLSFANRSCADAIADLCRWLPDATSWFDYTAGENPSLNITRRGDMAKLDLTAGQAPVVSSQLSPRLDLEVDQVRVMYAERDPETRKVKYVELSSGTAGTAQAGTANTITLASTASASDDAYTTLGITIDSGTGSGQTKTITDYVGSTKVATVDSDWGTQPDDTSVYTVGLGGGSTNKPSRQIVTVSGPEISEILPPDLFESEVVQTDALGTTNDVSVFYDNDPVLKDLGITSNLSVGTTVTFGGNTKYIPETDPAARYQKTGEAIPAGYNYYFIKGDYKDWYDYAGYNVLRCIAKATLYKRVNMSVTSYNAYDYIGDTKLQKLFWTADPADGGTYRHGHYQILNGAGELGYSNVVWLFYESQVDFLATDTNWSTETTLWREQLTDYGIPSGTIATDLAATQNWLPYEGNVILRENDIGGTQFMNRKLNIKNSISDYANMGAIVNSVTHDIDIKETTVTLGAPDRYSFANLVNRFRQSARDNVYEL